MSVVDVESLIQAVSADKPEGEDLEYAPEYLELDRLSQGKPEEQVGEVIRPAEEPDWREVRKGALELSARTRDMRIAILLTLGLLKTEGFAGLADGIAVIRGILERHWDVCYPKLDAEDNNDPTMRLMSMMPLCPPGDGSGDPVRLRKRIMEAPLSNSRQVGRFGLRDILIARGDLPAPPQVDGQPAPPDTALLDAAFDDTSTEDLQATATCLTKVIDDLNAIDALLVEKVGGGRGPNLKELVKLLQEIGKHLAHYLERKGVGSAAAGDGQAAETAATGDGSGGGAARRAPGASGGISGEILSREDAMRMMDKICAYFETYEPSSPVPLLLKRARRLTTMSFVDLIKDMSPEALARIELIAGASGEAPADGAAASQ